MTRPPFIVPTATVAEEQASYPGSDERLSFGRPVGKAAGLEQFGVWLERVAPGQRTSWPHAHERGEEFAYVVDGELDVWVDGHVHRVVKGDIVAFPAGTGVAHTFLNDGDRDAILLVGGPASMPDERTLYPLHPERHAQLGARAWTNAPMRALGPHDGKPRSR